MNVKQAQKYHKLCPNCTKPMVLQGVLVPDPATGTKHWQYFCWRCQKYDEVVD